MSKTLDFYYDIVSPTSYLAWTVAHDIASRTGAALNLVPVFLGGIMQATGNQPPGMLPARGKYMTKDVLRCAAHIGVPFTFNPNFPFNSLYVQRASVAMDMEERDRFATALMTLTWGQDTPVNPGNKDDLRAALPGIGFDPERILALASDEANKDALKANTEGAVAKGAFGAPTFFVGDEMFFGHDRLDYVERALGL